MIKIALVIDDVGPNANKAEAAVVEVSYPNYCNMVRAMFMENISSGEYIGKFILMDVCTVAGYSAITYV